MRKALDKINRNRYTGILSTALCALLLSLSCSCNPFAVGNIGVDSSIFQYVTRVILCGGMPYRDSFDHKGPLIYLFDACGMLINKETGIWIIELLFIFAAIYFAYKTAELTGCSNVKAVLVAFAALLSFSYYFDGGNLTEEYACTFIMISQYYFLQYFKNNAVSCAGVIICGASFAAVCLLRANMVVLWCVMCICVLIKCIYDKKGSLLAGFFLQFMLGAALVSVPVILWLARNHSLRAFIEDYFLFNIRYMSYSGAAFEKNILKSVYSFGKGGPVVLCALIMGFFCMKGKELSDLLCGTVFVLSLASICMSGHAFRHYGMILVPSVTYAFSLLLREIPDVKKHCLSVIAGTCLVLLLLGPGILGLAGGVSQSARHGISANMQEAQEIAAVIKQYTDEGDRITVCGNRNVIYLLSDRMSSSIYAYQYPVAEVSRDIQQAYISDLEKLEAQMIVIDASCARRDAVDDIVGKYYKLVKVVGAAEIYMKNEKAEIEK